jgi:transposase
LSPQEGDGSPAYHQDEDGNAPVAERGHVERVDDSLNSPGIAGVAFGTREAALVRILAVRGKGGVEGGALRHEAVRPRGAAVAAEGEQTEVGAARVVVRTRYGRLRRRIRETSGMIALRPDRPRQRAAEILSRLQTAEHVGEVQVYGELCVLPKDMTARQWVAHAGLDPRHFESGAFQGKTRISKAGNKYLRAALYMPAFNAILHQANVKAFYTRLVGKGKKEMQATVAVMRKLLHAIHGMLKSDTDFEGRKFFALEA